MMKKLGKTKVRRLTIDKETLRELVHGGDVTKPVPLPNPIPPISNTTCIISQCREVCSTPIVTCA
jgi:hypothetical protein